MNVNSNILSIIVKTLPLLHEVGEVQLLKKTAALSAMCVIFATLMAPLQCVLFLQPFSFLYHVTCDISQFR